MGTIDACLGVALADGPEEIVLTPGNIGQRYARERLGLHAKRVVQVSNFLGYSLGRVAQNR